jgi:hypothetical protein
MFTHIIWNYLINLFLLIFKNINLFKLILLIFINYLKINFSTFLLLTNLLYRLIITYTTLYLITLIYLIFLKKNGKNLVVFHDIGIHIHLFAVSSLIVNFQFSVRILGSGKPHGIINVNKKKGNIIFSGPIWFGWYRFHQQQINTGFIQY